MKARVKATGEIVTITGTDGICLTDENGNYHLIKDLEGCEAIPDYWDKLKHQAAISAMQGLLTNPKLCEIETANSIASTATTIASTLIDKLKEEKE